MPLKVGLFNDSFPPTIDGVANTVKNYAEVLSDMGCGVTVVTPKYPHVTDNYNFNVYRYFSINLNKSIGYRAGDVYKRQGFGGGLAAGSMLIEL